MFVIDYGYLPLIRDACFDMEAYERLCIVDLPFSDGPSRFSYSFYDHQVFRFSIALMPNWDGVL